MNNIEKILKKRILWKVYLAWFFKRILPLVVLEVLVIMASLYALARFVFVQQVFSNALLQAATNPLWLMVFMSNAFLHTSWLTKIAIVVFLGLGALLLRDLARALASYRSTSRVTK